MFVFKHVKWFLVSVAVVILTACGGGGSGGGDESTTPTNNGGAISENISKIFSYDDFGRVVKEDLGDGKYIEYIYDDSGNLIKQNVVK